MSAPYYNLIRIAQRMSPYLRPESQKYMECLEFGEFFCAQTRECFGAEIEVEIASKCLYYMTTRRGEAAALDISETVPPYAAHLNFSAKDSYVIPKASLEELPGGLLPGEFMSVSTHWLYRINLTGTKKKYCLLLPARYSINQEMQLRLGGKAALRSHYTKSRKAGEYFEWQMKT